MNEEDQILLVAIAELNVPGFHLTAQGKRDYDALVATGYRPTPEQLKGAEAYLRGDPS